MTPQQELERRLAALRATAKVHTSQPATQSSLTAQLELLDVPESLSPHPVIETKNISDDDVHTFPTIPSAEPQTHLTPIPTCQVEAYLASFSTPSTLPSTTEPPSADHRLNAALASYESIAPSFATPIEVSFYNPSLAAGPTRSEDEDEKLIRMLSEELSIEKAHGGAVDEDGETMWGKRLEGLKGVVVGGMDPGKLGPGEAPAPVEVQDFRDDSDSESEKSSKDSEKSDEDEDDD
ncbi:hypothetical protein P7C70_g8365, partial [Phenoliferia sp. Uapishka_3]